MASSQPVEVVDLVSDSESEADAKPVVACAAKKVKKEKKGKAPGSSQKKQPFVWKYWRLKSLHPNVYSHAILQPITYEREYFCVCGMVFYRRIDIQSHVKRNQPKFIWR